ncbi:hypothetical protein PGT21_002096 [Puccinia graminis f. sp. tritici]|uniref:Uncharacterized protein n=1 Tax=Puccinia graminis f. sp. tritici TaxID=56615 RepID=A0A5B0LJB8_PUCGR|nr:hypothetical protein PGT21_002096 [Puccinia graminis f. sp. tritici]
MAMNTALDPARAILKENAANHGGVNSADSAPLENEKISQVEGLMHPTPSTSTTQSKEGYTITLDGNIQRPVPENPYRLKSLKYNTPEEKHILDTKNLIFELRASNGSPDESKMALESNRFTMKDGTVIEIPQAEFDTIDTKEFLIMKEFEKRIRELRLLEADLKDVNVFLLDAAMSTPKLNQKYSEAIRTHGA